MRVIIRLILAAFLLGFSLATPVAAAEVDGVIHGQVINGSAEGGSAGGLEVSLEGSQNQPLITTTDAKGNFTFEGLNTDSSYSYKILLKYLDVEYSKSLAFGKDEITAVVELYVYETTLSDESISVQMSHTIINAAAGGLRVTEFFIFYNDSDRTYVGTRVVPGSDNSKETLRMPLPEGATDVELSPLLMECCVYIDGGLVYTMPILPGYQQAAYAYWIDNNSSMFTLERKVGYFQSSYELMVQGAGGVESQRLARGELLLLDGVSYEYFNAKDLPQDQPVDIWLSGLPQDIQQQTMLIVLATLLVPSLVFVVVLRRRNAKVVADGGINDKYQLLAEMARLDDEFEAGKIAEDSYTKQRTELKLLLLKMIPKSDIQL